MRQPDIVSGSQAAKVLGLPNPDVAQSQGSDTISLRREFPDHARIAVGDVLVCTTSSSSRGAQVHIASSGVLSATWKGRRILTEEEFAESDFPYPRETDWEAT